MPINVIHVDITRSRSDAIVNAANPSLLGGGGVDGAIHRAAGPALLQACRALPESAPNVRCPTGEARITPGFALPARYVIHTVGPVWQGGQRSEAALLERCHRQCMQLLREYGLRSIAFPAISCGVYGYPADQAAAIALGTLHDELQRDPSVEITVCCFSEAMRDIFQAALNAV